MSRFAQIGSWLDERLPLAGLREVALKKTVPIHPQSVYYYLGGMTLLFFIIQAASGAIGGKVGGKVKPDASLGMAGNLIAGAIGGVGGGQRGDRTIGVE